MGQPLHRSETVQLHPKTVSLKRRSSESGIAKTLEADWFDIYDNPLDDLVIDGGAIVMSVLVVESRISEVNWNGVNVGIQNYTCPGPATTIEYRFQQMEIRSPDT